jgi:hypothetical protein
MSRLTDIVSNIWLCQKQTCASKLIFSNVFNLILVPKLLYHHELSFFSYAISLQNDLILREKFKEGNWKGYGESDHYNASLLFPWHFIW